MQIMKIIDCYLKRRERKKRLLAKKCWKRAFAWVRWCLFNLLKLNNYRKKSLSLHSEQNNCLNSLCMKAFFNSLFWLKYQAALILAASPLSFACINLNVSVRKESQYPTRQPQYSSTHNLTTTIGSEAEGSGGFFEHAGPFIWSTVLEVCSFLRFSNGASLLFIIGDLPGVFSTRWGHLHLSLLHLVEHLLLHHHMVTHLQSHEKLWDALD